jgi:hypothetical protein
MVALTDVVAPQVVMAHRLILTESFLMVAPAEQHVAAAALMLLEVTIRMAISAVVVAGAH